MKRRYYINIQQMNRLLKGLVVLLLCLVYTNISKAQDKGVSFGGHVYSEDFPITKGYAYLYRYEDISTIVAPSAYLITKIDTLGFYYFYNVPKDKYIVYAGLSIGDPHFGQFAFTYYPNVALWQHSTPIEPETNTWDYHIHLINQDPENELGIGGRIAGKVSNSITEEAVDVILFDTQLQRVYAHLPIQDKGSFEFDNLPFGDYVVYPQVVGLQTNPKSLYLNETNTNVSNLQIEVKNQVGFVGIEEHKNVLSNYKLEYYNFDTNNMHLKLYSPKSQLVNYTLFNVNGQILAQGQWHTQSGSDTYVIDLQYIPSGVVFLQLSDNSQLLLKAKCTVF